MEALIKSLVCCLNEEGLDVVGVGRTESYNAIVESEGKAKLLSLLPIDQVVLCVGHSKGMWAHAKALMDKGVVDPFDTMSCQMGRKIAELCQANEYTQSCQCFYSHDTKPFLVSFQRLAVATEIGKFHDRTHLVINDKYGPWIAFRFAVVIKPSDGSQIDEAVSHVRSNKVVCWCGNFEVGEDEDKAVEMVLNDKTDTDVLTLLEARKSFITGRKFMYDDDQINYHYYL